MSAGVPADGGEPEVLDRELTGPMAWTGRTIGAEAGFIGLPDEALAELESVAAELKDNPLPILALAPEDFGLDACRGLMRRAKDVLDRETGFVVIDRLPVEGVDREIAVKLYWLLARMLARPVAQKWDGTMVYDVTDKGRPPGNGVRPDITNADQSFHTDNSYNLCPPEYVALLCLQTAMEGGINRVVSFEAAHNEMRRRHPELLGRLYRPYYFDRQREHAPGDVMTTHHPMLEVRDGQLTGRLSRFQVVNGQKLAGEPLDSKGEAALDAFEAVMNESAMARDFFFERGQIQIINNRSVGHKRTGFRDWPEPERKRHLVRLWLRDRGRPFYNG